MQWSTGSLPYLTIWKNTAAVRDGYVTGIEPGTGYPYNRRVERHYGRVPKLAPGQSRTFELSFSLLEGGRQVSEAIEAVEKIVDGRSTVIHPTAPENPFAD